MTVIDMGSLLSRRDLTERGWTGGMIRRHLGTAAIRDMTSLGAVDRWFPWDVRAAEARPDVRAALRDVVSRRVLMVTARRGAVAALSPAALAGIAAGVWDDGHRADGGDLEPPPMPAEFPDWYREQRIGRYDDRIARLRARRAELDAEMAVGD